MTTDVTEKKRSVHDLNNEELVKLYIALRDRRSTRKRAYEMEDESDKGKQEKIEGILLHRFQEGGMESVRTAHGTAYKETKTSCSCADRQMFFEFVKENELFDLLEARPAKTVVDQYVEAHGELPPGINYSQTVVIKIRRG